MKTLEEKLGYTFSDPALLENALTHSSRANESRGKLLSNERLEFLGDSILGMVVADHLYRNHPDLPEGDLTRTRAALVCEESLVEVARELGLGFWPLFTWTAVSVQPGSLSKSMYSAGKLPGLPNPWTTRPPFRNWSSGRADRCSSTAWWARRAPTTTSASL